MSSCIRNRAVVSMFWDLWQPKGLLRHPKTGRKLLLGQKYTQMALTMSQEDSQNTNKINIWQFKLDFQGVPKWIFASIIHSSHIITLSYVVKGCYKVRMHLNFKLLKIWESQSNKERRNLFVNTVLGLKTQNLKILSSDNHLSYSV